ncbi:hypothetical protein RI129_001588 [Pyrocoelia pectoralis]|uniref:Dynein axonemal intermediate chain 4 n=1 Tax=Pyrocoelia pectoralis TaxID=417401 RepID=A0AAN7VUR7_9COLE
MFSVNTSECVGFDSRWKVKGVYNESSSQTAPPSLSSISTDTGTSAEVETQTSDISVPYSKVEVDEEKLANWLAKVCPSVERELNEAICSKAFYGSYAYEGSVVPNSKLLQILNVANNSGDGDYANRVQAISWNSTGNTIAVACNYFHKSWCHHTGRVCFYTFNRDDKLPEVPHKILNINGCINVLRFHLTIPFIIACGTYSGEIVIWTIQHNDANNVIAKVNGHEEAVIDMSWIYDIGTTRSIVLASSSIDGLLNIWNFNLPLSSLTMKAKYKIKSPVLARSLKAKNSADEISKKVVRGILSFDFSTYSHELFVAGVEGGLLVLCSSLGANKLKGDTKEVPILDPVIKYYEPHDGEIITVRFSPNRKDMFMSCATDGEIRIYLTEQESPARVIFVEELYHASWVPFHEHVVAGCGKRGVLEIFHLISGQSILNVSTDKVLSTTLLQMEVNKQRCAIVAVGNNRGELQIWSVPWGHFSAFNPLE